ncbi:MAG: cytochrome P450 [Corynebacterium sp.]|nr:cytochrome P450 [Corynebacterium sp.]
MAEKIPGPRPLPGIGTLYTIKSHTALPSLMEVGRKYGEIHLQQLPGLAPLLAISSQRLVNEICDEDRFYKHIHPDLENLRPGGHDGLITAYTWEPNWGKAHRILMPAFSPKALRVMYDNMSDIAEQLVLKWERLAEDEEIDVPSDFTRLTLDTIALCAFSFRFNSFYSEQLHPFVESMMEALRIAGERTGKPEFVQKMNVKQKNAFQFHIERMQKICDSLIEQRRRDPHQDRESDILDTMLQAVDPKTGEHLPSDNVRNNLITFLVAGHETTSGMLSFALYLLMNNQSEMKKAREQVDQALQGKFPSFDDLPKLGYLDQVLRETLRLYPTAPAFAVTPYEKTTIGATDTSEGYEVNPGDIVLTMIPELHRDPEVWAEPDRFDPERFSFENAQKIKQNAWKPFGNGARACIGRGFALQEAQLVLAIILQRFDFEFADPNYELKIAANLTTKPDDFTIHVRPRQDGPTALRRGQSNIRTTEPGSKKAATTQPTAQVANHGTPMQVLYGSNAGTAKGFAEEIAQFGKEAGFDVSLSTLDDAVRAVRSSGPVIVVAASYEGLPPDNARAFVDWITSEAEKGEAGELSEVQYAVFGCGNTEWASTYQRIPTLIADSFAACGATALVERGVADARADFLGDFATWKRSFIAAIAETYGIKELGGAQDDAFEVEILEPNETANINQALGAAHFDQFSVIASTRLTDPDADVRRHKYALTLQLPDGAGYDTGDYVEVMPRNSNAAVQRVLALLGLPWSTQISLSAEAAGIPAHTPQTLGDVLAAAYDLNAPVSKAAIQRFLDRAECPPDEVLLRSLLDNETYFQEVVEKRLSLCDLVERLHALTLRPAEVFEFIPPLLPRRYSISSSALAQPHAVDLTVSVIDEAARSGQGNYQGIASNYLASLPVGTVVDARIVPGPDSFQMPKDLSKPMLLVGSGSGIAPLRGFLQELAHRKAAGESVATAHLYFGCRSESADYLYHDQLEEFAAQGLVELHPAFSRHTRQQNGTTVRYAQDAVLADSVNIQQLLAQGAEVFVCGAVDTVVPGARKAFQEIFEQQAPSPEAGIEQFSFFEHDEARFHVEAFS